jgi:WD40 repeat protein
VLGVLGIALFAVLNSGDEQTVPEPAPGIPVAGVDTPDPGQAVAEVPAGERNPQPDNTVTSPTVVSVTPSALTVSLDSVDVSGFPEELQDLAERVLAYRGVDPFEATAAALRTELVAFRRKHVGTALHHAAAPLMPHLPWPADALKHDEIPPEELLSLTCRSQDPPELVAILGTSRLRHWVRVSGVDVHPEGDIVVSGGNFGRLRLHDFMTGQRIAQVAHGHWGPCRFSPDGKLVAGGSGAQVEVRDARTLELRRTLRGARGPRGYPLSLAFTSDSQRIVVIFGGRRLVMFHVETGAAQWSIDLPDSEYVVSIALSHDDATVATAEQKGRVGLWDATTGTRLGELLTQTDKRVDAVAFSPTAKLLAIGCGYSVGVWDIDTQAELWKREKTTTVTNVAFSTDGHRLAYSLLSAPKQIEIVNASNGDLQTTVIPPHLTGVLRNAITALAFSPDGQLLVTGDEHGIVEWHDSETGETNSGPLGEPVEGELLGSAVSPDGALIATSGAAGTVSVWDAATARLLWTEKVSGRRLGSVAFHPDGSLLAVAAVHRVIIKQPATGKTVDELPIPSQSPPTVAFSPDGQSLVASGAQNLTLVWDVGTWRTRHRLPVGNSWLAVTPDSRKLLLASKEKPEVTLWDLPTGIREQTFPAPNSDISAISMHPLGRTVAVSLRGGPQLLDLGTGKWRSLKLPPNASTSGAALFHPDGRHTIWSGNGLHVLDEDTGRVIQHAVPHIPKHSPVAIFPDGRHVVIPTSQGTAYIVRLQSLPRGESSEKPSDADRGRRLAELRDRFAAGFDADPLANETKQLREDLLKLAHETQGTQEATTAGELARSLPWPADSLRREDVPQHELADLRGKGAPPPRELVAVLGDSRMWHWGIATAVVFSKDGSSLFSAGNDLTIIAQDPRTGDAQWIRRGLSADVGGLSLDPQERWLAVAHGRYCALLDPGSGEVVKQFPELVSGCRTVAFSSDGTLVAVGSSPDGPIETFATFNPETGQVVQTFRGHVGHVTSVSFHPDGHQIASGSDDGTVCIWNATTAEQLKTIRLEAERVTTVAFSPDGGRSCPPQP